MWQVTARDSEEQPVTANISKYKQVTTRNSNVSSNSKGQPVTASNSQYQKVSASYSKKQLRDK